MYRHTVIAHIGTRFLYPNYILELLLSCISETIIKLLKNYCCHYININFQFIYLFIIIFIFVDFSYIAYLLL